jgi:hypothetical protein
MALAAFALDHRDYRGEEAQIVNMRRMKQLSHPKETSFWPRRPP